MEKVRHALSVRPFNTSKLPSTCSFSHLAESPFRPDSTNTRTGLFTPRPKINNHPTTPSFIPNPFRGEIHPELCPPSKRRMPLRIGVPNLARAFHRNGPARLLDAPKAGSSRDDFSFPASVKRVEREARVELTVLFERGTEPVMACCCHRRFG